MFPPSFFDHLEDRLNLAVHDINESYRVEHGRPNSKPHLEAQGYALEIVKERTVTSAIDRIKAKALQAREIAPQAIRDFESDLDGILGEKAVLAQKRAAAVAPHKEAIAGIYGEFDGLKASMDLLTNGGPSLDPLPGSGTVEQS